MNFLLLGDLQLPLNKFNQTNLDSRCRVDALCYMIIHDGSQYKAEPTLSKVFNKSYDEAYKICKDTLSYYSKNQFKDVEHNTPHSSNIYINDKSDIEKVCIILQALLRNLIENQLAIFESKFIATTVNTLRNSSKVVKFKEYSFTILVNYMNFLHKKNEMERNEVFYELFACSFPYEHLAEPPVIVCKNLPRIKSDLEDEEWKNYLYKNDDIEYLTLLDRYYTELVYIIKKDPMSFPFWSNTIINCWVSYFYPELYFRYSPYLKVKDIPFPDPSSNEIGYHPYCPIKVQIMLSQIFLTILSNNNLKIFTQTYLNSKEKFYFLLDMFTEAYKPFKDKEIVEKYKNNKKYIELLEEYMKFITKIIVENMLPKQVEAYKYDIFIKGIESIISITNYYNCLLLVKNNILTYMKDSIESLMLQLNHSGNSIAIQEYYVKIFELFINTASQMQVYLSAELELTPNSLSFMTFLSFLLKVMFRIYFNFIHIDNFGLWNQVINFYGKYSTSNVIMLIWGEYAVKFTEILSSNLAHVTKEELELYNNPLILPFKDLPMKREFVLQVLFDAFCSLEEDKESEKYEAIRKTDLYCKCFVPWINLVRLVDITDKSSDKTLLMNYANILGQIVDNLVPIEKKNKESENKEYSKITVFPPPNTTIFYIIGSNLFRLYYRKENDLLDVRNRTLKIICALFCSNQSEVPLPVEFLGHIINTISLALVSNSQAAASTVLQITKNIFTLDYRGMLVLVPLYLNSIRTCILMSTKPTDTVNEDGKNLSDNSTLGSVTTNAAVSILRSLVSLTDYYEDYKIPSISDPNSISLMQDMKKTVYDLVLQLLKKYTAKGATDKTYLKVLNKAICCATIIIYQESVKPNPQVNILHEFVNAIIDKVKEGLDKVSGVGISCLCSLGYLFPNFYSLDKSLIVNIFHKLITELSTLTYNKFSKSSGDNNTYLTDLLNGLLELIMDDHFGILLEMKDDFISIFKSIDYVKKNFTGEIVDDGILLAEFFKEFYMNYPLRDQHPSIMESMFDEMEFYSLDNHTIKDYNRSLKKSFLQSCPRIECESKMFPEKDRYTPNSNENGDYTSSVSQYISSDMRKVNISDKSELNENDQCNKFVYLSYKNEAILTMIDSKYLTSKIIVRDLTGRHAWLITEHRVLDYNNLDSLEYDDRLAVYENIISLKGDDKIKEVVTGKKKVDEVIKEDKELFESQFDEILKSSPMINEDKIVEEIKKTGDDDLLTNVLSLLCKSCPDIQEYKNLVDDAELAAIEKNSKGFTFVKNTIIEQEQAEEKLFKLSVLEHEYNLKEEFKAELKALDCPYKEDKCTRDHVRSFLNRMSVIDSTFGFTKLEVNEESSKDFQRQLKFLDNDCSLRRSIKIGVIYVKRGQFDQKSILCNNKGSPKYEEFLQQLGQKPNKDLQKSTSLNPKVLCHYMPVFELMFHVVTLMATNPNDDQQVEKKKYVGNDSVHIIWSENDRAYKAGTITGSFNFAHIIVYPLRSGLYRIKVDKKKSKTNHELMKFFGPLLTGMIVTDDILVPLLRYTALNARKSIRYKNLHIFNPISERRKTLNKIIDKYGNKSKHTANQGVTSENSTRSNKK